MKQQTNPQFSKLDLNPNVQPMAQMSRSKKLSPLKNKPQTVPLEDPILNKKQIKERKQNTQVETKHKQRKFVLDEYDQKVIFLCQFCGGSSCPQQNYLTNKIQPNAIIGLHSNWITQNILAMQRPSTQIIQKYSLIPIFHEYNINTVLNLQEPGEHPYCGYGIDPIIGFSYDPQAFFTQNIRFQNQYWEDMTPTTFQQMMKILNIFHKSIVQRKGKISVHCHAGRGRTLMAICSWLIYYDRMTAEHTIQLAVEKRQGVLTRTSQRDFLKDFQKQLENRWKSYAFDPKNQLKTFSQYVVWQNLSILKEQLKQQNQTAFVHSNIIKILRNRMKENTKQIVIAFVDLNDKIFQKKWGNQHQHHLNFLKTHIDKILLQKIQTNEQIRILVTLLQDFYENLPFTPISLHVIDQLKKQLQMQRSIIKKQSQKRGIKPSKIQKKVLKRWQDIVSQRQNTTLNKQQLSLQSKIRQQNELQINTKQNFMISKQSHKFDETQNISQLITDSIYLNVLTQPSIVHQFGLNSLCTLLDIVKFVKELMQIYEKQVQNQSPQHFQLIQKCLLAKFSILMQSKKKYFPVLFRGQNQRQSKLMQRINKIQKYSNQNVQYLVGFMKNLMKQIPIHDREFKKLIFKLQKVESNISFFSKYHSESGYRFFSAQDAQIVYDQSRVE